MLNVFLRPACFLYVMVSDVNNPTRFVSNPHAVVLAVVPATEDVANSEALKLASQVDPTRERTVGVITKCDLMDDGTDCTALLANRTLPLKLGYIAVVNRGKKATVGGQKVGLSTSLTPSLKL